eukprot:m.166437 g.166437  ORF g.166437 m.166437 type:complete len:432 (-) comp12689_c0_seq1:119-1414(-)
MFRTMSDMETTTVVVVGAGPAGLGCAVLLKECAIECIVLERGRIGESFLQWPAETRFISPSFTGNFFGSVDLNAITPDSSPAYGLQTEHPTGAEYCRYLNDVVSTTKVDVRTGVEVLDVTGAEAQTRLPEHPPPTEGSAPVEATQADAVASATDVATGTDTTHDDHHNHDHHCHHHGHNTQESEAVDLDTIPTISVHTSTGTIGCKFFIWAGGEFQFPKRLSNTVRPAGSYSNFPVGKHVIIGGGESGMDAAHNLIKNGSQVTILDASAPWSKRVSDSSYGLSPRTLDHLKEIQQSGMATFIPESATEITATTVITPNRVIPLDHPAIDATGFDLKQSLAGKLFDYTAAGVPLLRMTDESSKFRNVFLSGPWVHHGKAVFCFVYKYRQRWAVVVRSILSRMGFADPGPIRGYAARGFLLDDLSCCAQSCVC